MKIDSAVQENGIIFKTDYLQRQEQLAELEVCLDGKNCMPLM
jgi:hypothetical protein